MHSSSDFPLLLYCTKRREALCRYTTVAASPYNKPVMILYDWKQNLCCYLDIFKEEGFVYFSTGISDISKTIWSCFGTLEALRLQQKVGVKRRFLVEYVWKSCAGPPEMQPSSSSPRCWWQMVCLFETICFQASVRMRFCLCMCLKCVPVSWRAVIELPLPHPVFFLIRVDSYCCYGHVPPWRMCAFHGWQQVSTPALVEPLGDSRMHRFHNCPCIFWTKRNESVASRGMTNRKVLQTKWTEGFLMTRSAETQYFDSFHTIWSWPRIFRCLVWFWMSGSTYRCCTYDSSLTSMQSLGWRNFQNVCCLIDQWSIFPHNLPEDQDQGCGKVSRAPPAGKGWYKCFVILP